MTTTQQTGTARARAAATRWSAMAAVTVQELRTPDACEGAADLLRQVWRDDVPPVPANLLRTVQHTGGYAFGAYDQNGGLVGASMGLLAAGDCLHSHITGVRADGRRRGLGLALKQHQRAWALERGLSRITWTCDPLVRRNVRFNLHRLGAQVVHYLPDHYGGMRDGVNAGDATDRLELSWDLASDRSVRAAEGRLPLLEVTDLPSAVVLDATGRPSAHRTLGPRTVALPEDVEAMRRTDPDAAHAWRIAVREALVPALADALRVAGVDTAGSLVLLAGGHL